MSNRKQRVALNRQNSSLINVHARVLQESILGALFILIHIVDLADDLYPNVNLFAEDTSLFSIILDLNASARELNKDQKKISKWAFQRNVNFNPNPSKQAQEFISSSKIKKLPYPSLVFNKNNVLQASSQKYLGITLHPDTSRAP